jgi:7,8-dihydropterin-6-yl-methyl-4-(beta-D-ribofuranosyl)aminobenzene 5'-phosphate synthase
MRWRIWALAVIVGLMAIGCDSSAKPVGSVEAVGAMPTAVNALVPAPTGKPTQTAAAIASAGGAGPVTFTIVYDNNAYDTSLRTAWGFACLVEIREARVLFDTGGNGEILLGNMERLGIDPQALDAVVLSHAHGDHTDGLGALLETGAKPTVYVPASFSAAFKDGVSAQTELVEVTAPIEIVPGVRTTGEVGSGIIEQALVVRTDEGLVVITGCAHPGVVEMVRAAKETVASGVAADVFLVMGGFHLGDAGRSQIQGIIADFGDLGVQRVAPCHCTGDGARQMFAEAFGDNCTLAGVGQVFLVGGTE